MEELYEKHPEMREALNEARFQFEEQTGFTENLTEVNDALHRVSVHGKKVQEKALKANEKLTKASKHFDDKYAK